MHLVAGLFLAVCAFVSNANEFPDAGYQYPVDSHQDRYRSVPNSSARWGDQSRYAPQYGTRSNYPAYNDRNPQPPLQRRSPEQNVFGGGAPARISRPIVPNTFGGVPGPAPSFSPPGLYRDLDSDWGNEARYRQALPPFSGPYGYADNPYDEPYGEGQYSATEFDHMSGPFGYGVGPGYGPSVDPSYLGFE